MLLCARVDAESCTVRWSLSFQDLLLAKNLRDSVIAPRERLQCLDDADGVRRLGSSALVPCIPHCGLGLLEPRTPSCQSHFPNQRAPRSPQGCWSVFAWLSNIRGWMGKDESRLDPTTNPSSPHTAVPQICSHPRPSRVRRPVRARSSTTVRGGQHQITTISKVITKQCEGTTPLLSSYASTPWPPGTGRKQAWKQIFSGTQNMEAASDQQSQSAGLAGMPRPQEAQGRG